MGHSGQSCPTPCFMCKLKWGYKGEDAPRLDDFDFSQVGEIYDPADLKEVLINFDVDSVSPPGLHTILGLVQYYILSWMIALCNNIDSIVDHPSNYNINDSHRCNELMNLYNTRKSSALKFLPLLTRCDACLSVYVMIHGYDQNGEFVKLDVNCVPIRLGSTVMDVIQLPFLPNPAMRFKVEVEDDDSYIENAFREIGLKFVKIVL